ncbi:hypothetical protein RRG08_067004 [Elysia crispata]|uniref:Uncharacterized protein n=1 Tax=Elysia crispata TaxID=231223 RepID=A0AAE0Z9P5_9GAST|nr:hypothetical protein RRG08_067004 [Elysia crispata]
MASLVDFMDCVTTQDTRRRIQAHSELVPFLSDPRSSLECEDYELDSLIEGLAAWVRSSNFKRENGASKVINKIFLRIVRRIDLRMNCGICLLGLCVVKSLTVQ